MYENNEILQERFDKDD